MAPSALFASVLRPPGDGATFFLNPFPDPPRALPIQPPPDIEGYMSQPSVRASYMAKRALAKAAQASEAAGLAAQAGRSAEKLASMAQAASANASVAQNALVELGRIDSMVRSVNRIAAGALDDDVNRDVPWEVLRASRLAESMRRRHQKVLSAAAAIDRLALEERDYLPPGFLSMLENLHARALALGHPLARVAATAAQQEAELRSQYRPAPPPPRLPSELLRPDGEPWWPEPVPGQHTAKSQALRVRHSQRAAATSPFIVPSAATFL